MKILIDSDVCLDSITDRYPFSNNSNRILEKIESGDLKAIVSAESFSNMYYILQKLSSHRNAITILMKLRKILGIGVITEKIVDEALNSEWTDFEDAIQYYCAIDEKCDAIITRNIADFKSSGIPVYTPQILLEELTDQR